MIKDRLIGNTYEFDGVDTFWKISQIRKEEMKISLFIGNSFEILNKQDGEKIDIQAIKEFEFGETEEKTNYENRTKINELIKAVKQLDKNKEDK